jgi:hypothetical protein
MAKYTKEEQYKAMTALHIELNAKDTVYTVLRHNTPKTHYMDFVVIKDNRPINISYQVATLLQRAINDHFEGVRCYSSGSEMVQLLSRALKWGDDGLHHEYI